jgi:flagellar motor component MotA
MVVLTGLAGLMVGALAWFIDAPSLILILIALVYFFVATKSGGVIGNYIKTSFKKEYVYSKAELESIAATLNNTMKITHAVGCFGMLTGLVAFLRHLSNPDLLGPNLAVSLITMLYSIAISYFVFFPAKAWAENRLKLIEKGN